MTDGDLGPRWSEGPLLGRQDESEARAFLAEAPAPAALTDLAARRVLRRLRSSWAAPPPRRWLRATTVTLALALAGAAAAARALPWRRHPAVRHALTLAIESPPARAVPEARLPPVVAETEPRRRSRAPVSSGRLRRRAPHAAPGRPAGSLLAQASLAEEPPIPEAPPPEKATLPAETPSAEAPSAANGTLDEETRLFRAALARLRVDRDPHGALALLDGYAAAFPQGSYRAEAAVARVDALLAAGQHSDALDVLRSLPLATLPRRLELTVMRGELASAADDCRAARADFDGALAERLPPSIEERALYGRAVCRERMGDRTGARADLARYLARFPDGKFAGAARPALATP